MRKINRDTFNNLPVCLTVTIALMILSYLGFSKDLPVLALPGAIASGLTLPARHLISKKLYQDIAVISSTPIFLIMLMNLVHSPEWSQGSDWWRSLVLFSMLFWPALALTSFILFRKGIWKEPHRPNSPRDSWRNYGKAVESLSGWRIRCYTFLLPQWSTIPPPLTLYGGPGDERLSVFSPVHWRSNPTLPQ